MRAAPSRAFIFRIRRSADPSKTNPVYCREGFRVTTAASILLREITGQIVILIDGIEG
jgi:hypothetical protein